MKSRKSKSIYLAIAIFSLLTACAMPPVRKTADVELVARAEQTPVQVYVGHGELYLGHSIDNTGKKEYLRADWTGKLTKTGGYSHGSVELAAITNPERDWESFPEALVLDESEWTRVFYEAGDRLAPESPYTGLSLVTRYIELILYRDDQSNIHFKKIEHTPVDVKIVGDLSEESVIAAIFKVLGDEREKNGLQNHRYLFHGGSIPHEGTAFAYIDLEKKESIYLTVPRYSEYDTIHQIFTIPTVTSFRWLTASGVMTTIKNPFTTVYRFIHNFKDYVSAATSGVTSYDTPPPDLSSVKGMDLKLWEEQLDQIVDHKRYEGTIQFLIDGESVFSDMIASFREAEDSIFLRTYIFDNDDYAVKIADILRKQSHSLDVRVLMDHLGSMGAASSLPSTPIPVDFEFPSNISDYLETDSKVDVRKKTNPWFSQDHTKTTIVDEKIAYIGGINIGREYRYEWHDLMMRVEGPIVRKLVTDFDENWAHAGPGGDFALLGTRLFNSDSKDQRAASDASILIRPLYTSAGNPEILNAQIAAINNAREYIYIENPYLADNSILDALIRARYRGVDVRVIIPASSDYEINDSSNIVTANILIKNGIRVYQLPRSSHIKAAIYDGWACLGSANFDNLSLRINQETNLAFSDPETVNRLRTELFDKDFSESTEITAPFPVGIGDHVNEWIVNLL